MPDVLDPLDTKTPGSPGWWLLRLEKKLADRCTRYEKLEEYYSGNHPLPEGDDRMREVFRRFQRKARSNYMPLVADSVSERLEVVGFRSNGTDTGNDADAWQIWQANHLDADSSIAHSTASKFSDVYVLIGPPDDDNDDAEDGPQPVITIEDPRQVIVDTDPTNRRVVRAAAKIWIDDVDNKRHAVLYMPDAFYYFESEIPNTAETIGDYGVVTRIPENEMTTWRAEIVDEEGEDPDDPETFDSDPDDRLVGSRVANPVAPIVPVVRLVANPGLDGEGVGEFEKVIDIQDRINDTILNRLVVGKMQAYRQRWAKGIASEDEDGNELPIPFVPGVDLLWTVEDANAEFGSFEQSSLDQFLKPVEDDVKAIVTLTGLPPHYVQGDIVNASADALASAESRLVSKVRARMRSYGESWEAVMRLAFRYLDQPDHIGVGAEVQWANPERQSLAQIADSVTKKMACGVPWEQCMIDLGYTPTQIEQMRSDRVSDALMFPAPAPAPAPAPVPVPPDAPAG